MIFLLLHVICSCIFHSYVPIFVFLLILNVFGTFPRVLSFSLSLFLSVNCSIAPKCKYTPSRNPLHFRASFSSPLLILHPPMSSSMMIKPIRTFRRTFHDVAFIRNAKSFYWTFLILTFPLSSTVKVGSHCVASDHLSLRDHTGVLLQYAQI